MMALLLHVDDDLPVNVKMTISRPIQPELEQSTFMAGNTKGSCNHAYEAAVEVVSLFLQREL